MKLLCKSCKKELKTVPQSFDAFSFLNPITLLYCENKECDEYGYVVVVGYQVREEDYQNSEE